MMQVQDSAWRAPRASRIGWVAGVALIGALLLGLRVLAGPAPEVAAVTPVMNTATGDNSPATPTTDLAALPATPQAAVREQQDAARAAAAIAGQPPLRGPVTARPGFVSETEWQVLQAVARQKADHERELTRLVNSLRFNKQLELWRNAAALPQPAQRRVLGEQLLAELPEHVQQREMARPDAEKLQRELLAALEPDPAARQARITAEARRLQGLAVQEETGTLVPRTGQ